METHLRGVGFNLRPEWLDFIINEQPPVPYLEIIVDNWFSPGPHHKKLAQVRRDYELLFHCVGMNLGGDDPLDWEYLGRVQELASRFQPLHISDHLCFQHYKGQYFHDLLPIPLHEDSLHHCKNRVEQVIEQLERPLLIENLSYYVQYENSTMMEADFIAHLCQATGTKILLDLNNIWVNEQNLGISFDDFITSIPRQVIGEIHLAGPEMQDSMYVDTHGTDVVEDVKTRFSTIVKEVNVPVIYERDNNLPHPQDIVRICQELEQLC